MSAILVLPLLLGQKPDLKPWQVRYEGLIAAMKAKDTAKVSALFHPDYTEHADGVKLDRKTVIARLPQRYDLVRQFAQPPKVLSARVVGNTATISVEMNFKATMTEDQKPAVYTSVSRQTDTWLKVKGEFKLFRSVVESSVTKRNGQVVKAPKGGG